MAGEVSNEWNQNKTDEPIGIDLNNLKAGFNIKSATVWEGNKEIPSQLDDPVSYTHLVNF